MTAFDKQYLNDVAIVACNADSKSDHFHVCSVLIQAPYFVKICQIIVHIMPWTLVVSSVSVLSNCVAGQMQEWILDLLCTIMLSV